MSRSVWCSQTRRRRPPIECCARLPILPICIYSRGAHLYLCEHTNTNTKTSTHHIVAIYELGRTFCIAVLTMPHTTYMRSNASNMHAESARQMCVFMVIVCVCVCAVDTAHIGHRFPIENQRNNGRSRAGIHYIH